MLNSNAPERHSKDSLISALVQTCTTATHWPEERKDGNFCKGNPNSLYEMKNHGMLTFRANPFVG